MASSSTPRPPSLRIRTSRQLPMARFSIGEHEDGTAPPTTDKRRRRYYSPPPSRSHTSPDEEDEDEELVPAEDVESDSQEEEELEDDDGDDDDEEEQEESEDGEDENVVVEEVDEFDYSTLLSLRTSSATPRTVTAMTPEAVVNVAAVTPEAAVNATAVDVAPVIAAIQDVASNGNEEIQGVFTDPDVLDCPICLDALSTPVFQCENGHIACSSCCSKVNRKCPSCCMPIGYNRCRAIEKVIESVKVSCKNAQYGCTTRMIYNNKNEHEKICPHVPCFCPYLLCSFSGSSKNLYLHFGIHHAASTTRFTYNTTFTVRVERDQKQTFLQEQNESVIFILNHELKENDHAFNVDCVGPSSLKTSFGYELTAKSSEATLSLHCVPEVYAKWSEHTLKKNYLRVLSDFSGWNGVVILNVCIKKAI